MSSINRPLIDDRAKDALAPFLLSEEQLAWAQPSMPSDFFDHFWSRSSELFWLCVMLVLIAYGAPKIGAWLMRITWPNFEVLVGVFSFAAGVSIGVLILRSLFQRPAGGDMIYAITDKRILAANSKTQDRTSIVATMKFQGSISVKKNTQNMGTLTLWNEFDDEGSCLEMRRVREIDAAERLILANFVRSTQEDDNE